MTEVIVEDIIQMIFTQEGLLSTLFVGLLLWVLKKNDDREVRYINTIDNLTKNVSEKIINIEDDIQDIKDTLTKESR